MSQDSRHALSFRFATLLLLVAVLAGVSSLVAVQAAPAKPPAEDEQAEQKDAEKDTKKTDEKKKKADKQAAEKKAAEKKAAEKKAAEKKAKEKAAEEKAKKTAEEAVRSQPKKHPPGKRAGVFSKKHPENLDDLRAIEKQVAKVVEKALACVVGVRIGVAQGSAVIISADGYVLTAGHVCGAPGRDVTFLFADGKTARGKTLGVNLTIDSGLMKITDKGPWPHLDLGDSSKLKPGDWVIAIGHPRGFELDRPPVVRTGRVIRANEKVVQTGCTLFSGDSGGPLLDVDGRVIGIHSRIGGRTSQNFHVPIDTFHNTWDQLAAGEIITRTELGINGKTVDEGCRITKVWSGKPAAKAGLKVGDVVTKFDGKAFAGIVGMSKLIRKHKVGDEVELEILRDGKKMKFKVKLGSRSR